jgi:DnaJ-class molecular chaperone
MGKDYYAVLGVPRSANADSIKKAYRTLAMRWHPDKNPDNVAEAQSKFQEISEAYDVLSDADKRRIYDQFGEEGLKRGGNTTYTFSSRNAEDLFHSFFNDFEDGSFSTFFDCGRGSHRSPFNFFSFGAPQPPPPPPRSLEIAVFCTLEQLFTGETRRLKVTRTVGGTDDQKLFELQIRPGWKEGTKITYAGEGDQQPGRPPQDVVFVIRQRKHEVFTREKDDLLLVKNLGLKDALCGFFFEQIGIDGELLRQEIDVVVGHGDERRFSGKGMPKKGGGRGDLIVRFEVVFPTKLTEEQKEILRATLTESEA